MTGRINNKVALITGAGSGIGKSCSVLFAKHGAKLSLADVKKDSMIELSKKINSEGGESFISTTDVTSNDECKSLVEKTYEKYGRLDILINSAGVTPRYAPKDWDFEKKWDWVIDVNLKGSMMMSYYAIKKMKLNNGGSIINLASIIGLVGYAQGLSDGFNPYPHSKGGIVQMTRDMAVAFGKSGIRVNSLCPGFTYTPLTKTLTDDSDEHQKLISLHPMGRLGEVEEIAKAALFLASDDASFITGINMPVDGGYTAQ